MKIFNNIFKCCAVLALAFSFAACQEEDNLRKPSALISESSMTFEAEGNESQLLMIASDDEWMIDIPVDWVSIDPMRGTNTVYVSVSVEDNKTDGVLNAPRECKITIADNRGYSVTTMIYQKGDNYLGVSEMTVAQVIALEDEKYAKIAEAQVVAAAAEGFVAKDASGLIFVQSQAEVSLGDNVYIAGEKVTLNGLATLVAGDVVVKSNAEVTHPEAVDMTSQVDSYAPESIQYVKIEGTVVGNSVKNIPGMPAKSVAFLTAHSSIDIESVAVHKVTMYAYHIGFNGGAHQLVVSSFTDNGADDAIGVAFPFKDSFDWTQPYIEAANQFLAAANQINDVVALQSSSADGAANIYSTLASNGCMVLDELRARGYTDLNPSMKTIYLHDGYFKFGKGACQSGLTLPLMQMPGEQNIVVQFKWCAHIGGGGGVDKTELVVAIEGPGSIQGAGENPKVSAPIASTQQSGQMFWQDVVVYIDGATSGTFITIRPKDEQFGSSENPVSGYYRYHLDNISVMSVDDFVPANVDVTGVDDGIITFEGTPEAPVTFSVYSDKNFTVESDVNWLDLSVTEGLANVPTDVIVTCHESSLSELRRGTIKVKSGTTVYTINVIQSAAGVALAPFISLVDGNTTNVDGMTGTITVEVQANVGYDVTSTVDWLEVLPASKALVDFTSVNVSKKANLTGAQRTGQLVFRNEENNVETILNVVQELFEPEIKLLPSKLVPNLPGTGGTYQYTISANVPYTVSTEDAWVTLPAAEGPATEITVPIAFAENTTADYRTATVKFYNAEYDYTAEFSVNQAPAGVLYADDFSWMAPAIAYYNANQPDGMKIGDTVNSGGSDSNAPNSYTDATWLASGFWETFNALGYVDSKSDLKVMYPQDTYLKFGRTGGVYQTGIYLPAIDPQGKDLVLTFDWCAAVQGSGKIDPTEMVVEIEGDGVCGDTNEKISTPIISAQETGTYSWQKYSVTLKGLTSSSRLYIHHKDLTVKGGRRYYLDNIVVSVAQ